MPISYLATIQQWVAQSPEDAVAGAEFDSDFVVTSCDGNIARVWYVMLLLLLVRGPR